MTILSFCEKKLKNQENQTRAQSSEEGCLEKDLSKNINGKLIQLSHQSKKVIHFNKFQLLRQAAKWENSKLRNGLSLKVHQFRKEIEQALLEENNATAENENHNGILLDLASEYSDYMLYGEGTTVQLLNKYTEYKDLLNLKFEEFKNILSV